MSSMSDFQRIKTIKKTPLSYKALDNITAAERFMTGIINAPIISYVAPCFANLEEKTVNLLSEVWQFNLAALHLKMKVELDAYDGHTAQILRKAYHVYEQESLRFLSTLFPLQHPYWQVFYKRQSAEITQALTSIDALYFMTSCKSQLEHQLLVQCIQLVLHAYYQVPCESEIQKNKKLDNALQLIVDLPVTELKQWITNLKLK